MTQPPAVGYTRVSTSEQCDEGVSLDAQQAKLRAWAELNGYCLVAVHVDAGLSGKQADNRPGLQAAIADACRLAAPLVTYSLSRIGRSTMDVLDIGARLERAGAAIVSLSERVDSTSASGKLVFRLMAALAEFERDQLVERTRLAMAHLRGQGRRISGRVPYGHRLAADGRYLEPITDEKAVVADMRRQREAGATYQAIVDDLRRRGVPSKCGRAAWTTTTVRGVLLRARMAS